MKINNFKILSTAETSRTSQFASGSVLSEFEFTFEIKKLFRKKQVITKTVQVFTKRTNQLYHESVYKDTGLLIGNRKFAENVTDLIVHELKKIAH